MLWQRTVPITNTRALQAVQESYGAECLYHVEAPASKEGVLVSWLKRRSPARHYVTRLVQVIRDTGLLSSGRKLTGSANALCGLSKLGRRITITDPKPTNGIATLAVWVSRLRL